MFSFLFWLVLSGIIIATLQDLKRREVDDWLNLFILFSGIVFIFYRAIFEKNVSLVFQLGFSLVIMFVIINLLYYSRIFAGGDAKLLMAMTPFFIGAKFSLTMLNVGMFLLFLFFFGSLYGIIYSLFLYFRCFRSVNSEIAKKFSNVSMKYYILVAILFLVLSFFDLIFLVFVILVLLFPVMHVFAVALESVCMVRIVSSRDLREGDWLVKDIRVGKKVVKSDWDGISASDIKLLQRKKKVLIKDGLPFVPAFLIAFFGYVFLKELILRILM
jgi:Flp pilus assembly protein protease CpaA